MKWVLIAICGGLLFYTAHASTEECKDTHFCDSTNYQSYVECVRRRQKRSTDCNSGCEGGNCVEVCQSCDCTTCNYASCQTECNSCCNSCCNNYIPCTTNHCCHKTCHAQCSTSTCRSSCRQNCFNNVERNTQLATGGSSSNATVNTGIKHNVTTVIHLNNVINNTNVIDIPINLNSTNLQNVSLTESNPSYPTNSGGSPSGPSGEPCCTVIGPKECVSKPKPRCFHIRSHQCGAFCTTPIVHKEQEQICESMYPGAPNMCKQQVVYIPQPRPRCSYQAEWPYVRCGVQRSEACAGCYGHYVDPKSSAHLSCPFQCYDDGFNNGPLYRQGPIYRPMYSHMPYGGNPFQYGGNQFAYGGMGMPMYGYGMPPAFSPYTGGDYIQDEAYLNASSPQVMDPMISVGQGLDRFLPVPLDVGQDVNIQVVTQHPDREARQIQKEATVKLEAGRDKRTPEPAVNVNTSTISPKKQS